MDKSWTEECRSDNISKDMEDEGSTDDIENDRSFEEQLVGKKTCRVSVTEQNTIEPMKLRNKVRPSQVENSRDTFPEVPVRLSYKKFNPDILEELSRLESVY